jgi:hypothetical protein
MRINYKNSDKSFRVLHNSGSDFFAYQLLRESIGNWIFEQDLTKYLLDNKANLSEQNQGK